MKKARLSGVEMLTIKQQASNGKEKVLNLTTRIKTSQQDFSKVKTQIMIHVCNNTNYR